MREHARNILKYDVDKKPLIRAKRDTLDYKRIYLKVG